MLVADDQHLVTRDAQSVARFTGAGPGQRLLGGDPHRAVPGARRGAGHGVAVVDGLARRIVHGQRGQPLHHRPGGHGHHVDAPADRGGAPRDEFLGGDVAVGQHHDLRGAGVDERAQQLFGADRRVGVGPQHVRALACEQFLRAVTVDDGQHRPLRGSNRRAGGCPRRR